MKRMLSGIKPTGRVTLGNYIGAIKPFVSYQDEYEMIVFVANLHLSLIHIFTRSSYGLHLFCYYFRLWIRGSHHYAHCYTSVRCLYFVCWFKSNASK